MSSKRKVSNPLALAVLACLFEKPMHPYEMAATMRQRGKDVSIKLNYGSLYSVVESLQKQKLIRISETERDGNRPERTVYQITDAGRLELSDWLSELLDTPVKEYTQFEAGLSLLATLSPEDALARLKDRCGKIELELAQLRSARDHVSEIGLPRIFWLEGEYWYNQRKAELEWTKRLVQEMSAGKLEGQEQWTMWHENPAAGWQWQKKAKEAGE